MAAEVKTKPTNASVTAFLKKAAKDKRLELCEAIARIMAKATGKKPVMWGTEIVGYDTYPIVYADGHTEQWPVAAFSPRKEAVVIYGTRASPKYAPLLKKLGKHTAGGGCVYVKSLADIDVKVLDELIATAVKGRLARVKR